MLILITVGRPCAVYHFDLLTDCPESALLEARQSWGFEGIKDLQMAYMLEDIGNHS